MPGKPLNPIIFPLRNVSSGDIPALQYALLPNRMLEPVFMQQRPRSTSRLLAPELPVNRPWNVTSDKVGIIDIPTETRRLIPSVVHELLPYPPTYFRIFGITKDSAGAVLGNCVVHLFRTADDVEIDQSTSNAIGEYEFRTASTSSTFYVVAYKAGSPDVAGTTVNTLVGS